MPVGSLILAEPLLQGADETFQRTCCYWNVFLSACFLGYVTVLGFMSFADRLGSEHVAFLPGLAATRRASSMEIGYRVPRFVHSWKPRFMGSPCIYISPYSVSRGSVYPITRFPSSLASRFPSARVQRCSDVLPVRVSQAETGQNLVYEEGELSAFFRNSEGVQMPRIMYESVLDASHMEASSFANLTEDAILRAVHAGFRGLDAPYRAIKTSLRPPCYGEAEMGAALSKLNASGRIRREDLFIQTKVSPYRAAAMEPSLPIRSQVLLAVENSRKVLGLEYIDSVLLMLQYDEHWQTMEHWQKMEAWTALEDAMALGVVRQIGLSTSDFLELIPIYVEAKIKPQVVAPVQNGFDPSFIGWCQQNGVHVQRFGKFSPEVPSSDEELQQLVEKYGTTLPVLLFRFMMGLGVVLLTGPENDEDMQLALSALRVPLSAEDSQLIAGWLPEPEHEEHPLQWAYDCLWSAIPDTIHVNVSLASDDATHRNLTSRQGPLPLTGATLDISIVSDAFQGVALEDRRAIVYKALEAELSAGRLQSVAALETWTEEEWLLMPFREEDVEGDHFFKRGANLTDMVFNPKTPTKENRTAEDAQWDILLNNPVLDYIYEQNTRPDHWFVQPPDSKFDESDLDIEGFEDRKPIFKTGEAPDIKQQSG